MVKKLPINIIVEAKVFIVGNNVPDNLTVNYDGVYTVERGDNVTLTLTAVTDIGPTAYQIVYVDSVGNTTTVGYVDEMDAGDTMDVVIPVEDHTIVIIVEAGA